MDYSKLNTCPVDGAQVCVMPFQRYLIEIGTYMPIIPTPQSLVTAVYFDSLIYASAKHKIIE